MVRNSTVGKDRVPEEEREVGTQLCLVAYGADKETSLKNVK